MKHEKTKSIFVDGPISAGFIAEAIAKHHTKKNIGAHSIFLGQVRNDTVNEQEVLAIEYSAYMEMAAEKLHEIREDAFGKYSLICLHIYHSLGKVSAGEINLFVFTSSTHRKDAIEACKEIVERIKKEVPVWGKEIFGNESFQWKINT
jgi:molybdopterin synthase catalytic subunit